MFASMFCVKRLMVGQCVWVNSKVRRKCLQVNFIHSYIILPVLQFRNPITMKFENMSKKAKTGRLDFWDLNSAKTNTLTM